MSFIYPPIANFLSLYGNSLNKIFNISSKIPIVCMVDPTGAALGGAGTVGDEEFLANFTTASGGTDSVKAFDISGPIPLMCMVNPDGTAYESYSAPYQELSLNWYQASTDEPTIARTNINTLSPATTVTTGYLGVGIYTFDFDQDIFPIDRSKVEIAISIPRAATGTRILAYQIQAANSVIVRSLDFAGAAVDVVGYEPAGTYSTLNIKIYP